MFGLQSIISINNAHARRQLEEKTPRQVEKSNRAARAAKVSAGQSRARSGR